MTDDAGLNIPELKLIAEILMGAAMADGEYDGSEAETIEGILRDLVGPDQFPGEVGAHIEDFDHGGFDATATAKRLNLATAEDRKSLLALIAEVTDADDVHDMREDAYIKEIAEAIGAGPDELEGLTVEMVSISAITSPPPLPPGAE